MKKSVKNWMGIRFVAGPADNAVIVTVGPPPHGYLVYWKHGTRLQYKYFQGVKERISLYKRDVTGSKRIRGRYTFKPEGLTHIYVYTIELDKFVYAGLYPISNPLGLKTDEN